jgi:ribonuclease HI
MTAKNSLVENRDLIIRILAMIKTRSECGSSSKFENVMSHSGSYGNEAADTLVRRGPAEHRNSHRLAGYADVLQGGAKF